MRCARATAGDVAAAVNFARTHNLRLVVKGGGHSYQGTSNAPDSLLVWTRAMNQVQLHDAFVGAGCAGTVAPVPAVSAGAGAMWIDLYQAVTTQAGRYVQGGGCATVGVAGLIQSGGFGSFSKGFGSACASLLEAEVVTADGTVRVANACTQPGPVLGAQGRRRWQLGRRDAAHAAHPPAAGVLRLRGRDGQGAARMPPSAGSSPASWTSMRARCSIRTGASRWPSARTTRCACRW